MEPVGLSNTRQERNPWTKATTLTCMSLRHHVSVPCVKCSGAWRSATHLIKMPNVTCACTTCFKETLGSQLVSPPPWKLCVNIVILHPTAHIFRPVISKRHLVRTCWENGTNATAKNYDQLETGRKEKTRSSPKNLERWDINSHEWKRSQNGRMEQSKTMEYGSRKASPDVLKPCNLYIYIYVETYSTVRLDVLRFARGYSWPGDCLSSYFPFSPVRRGR
jgi:hypothetical protein